MEKAPVSATEEMARYSDAISRFGTDLGLMHEVIITGRRAGADARFYTKLVQDVDLFRAVVRFFRAKTAWRIPPIEVSHHLRINQLVNNAEVEVCSKDQHEFSACNIDAYDPTTSGSHHVSIEIQQFPVGVPLHCILAEIKESGYRPATLREILHLRICRQDCFRGMPYALLNIGISASNIGNCLVFPMGTIVNGFLFPILVNTNTHHQPQIMVFNLNYRTSANCLFAVVKVSPPL